MRPAFTTLIMRERDFLSYNAQNGAGEANEALYFYYYLNGPKASTSLRAESITFFSLPSVLLRS